MLIMEKLSKSQILQANPCFKLFISDLEHPGLVEGVPAPGSGWDWMSFKISSNPYHSEILCTEAVQPLGTHVNHLQCLKLASIKQGIRDRRAKPLKFDAEFAAWRWFADLEVKMSLAKISNVPGKAFLALLRINFKVEEPWSGCVFIPQSRPGPATHLSSAHPALRAPAPPSLLLVLAQFCHYLP